MSISEQHIVGLRDLLVNETNIPVLLQLTKSVTKNVCKVEEPEEALGYLTSHVDDIHKLLHKRHITRDLLFKYLHTRLPCTSTDFTKADLVMRVIKYWDQQGASQNLAIVGTHNAEEQQFPIHLIARKFGEWFFNKYNNNDLCHTDLWSDAALHLKVIADDGASELECVGVAEVLDALVKAKQTFDFYFNPNLSHSGVQGRMDPYGQVVVLCCGTLHSEQRSVGVFECSFGLLRDPHACNNWKPKKFKCLLRSAESPPPLHTLIECDTLQEALALPAPSDTLDQL
ncbi:uncharacterized protein C3orf38 homolog [Drosophila grimshawi]|uniref:GH15825 n=1 Tax=Drosophila grimshawi TaxID=7222 RepID=B4IZR6_DROGR|nr:uncharacterized protein C3orf38 homolog [Drosophila grimshawi]EDV95651.1 GH15825 [Drosophila grimshawi]